MMIWLNWNIHEVAAELLRDYFDKYYGEVTFICDSKILQENLLTFPMKYISKLLCTVPNPHSKDDWIKIEQVEIWLGNIQIHNINEVVIYFLCLDYIFKATNILKNNIKLYNQILVFSLNKGKRYYIVFKIIMNSKNNLNETN